MSSYIDFLMNISHFVSVLSNEVVSRNETVAEFGHTLVVSDPSN